MPLASETRSSSPDKALFRVLQKPEPVKALDVKTPCLSRIYLTFWPKIGFGSCVSLDILETLGLQRLSLAELLDVFLAKFEITTQTRLLYTLLQNAALQKQHFEYSTYPRRSLTFTIRSQQEV